MKIGRSVCKDRKKTGTGRLAKREGEKEGGGN